MTDTAQRRLRPQPGACPCRQRNLRQRDCHGARTCLVGPLALAAAAGTVLQLWGCAASAPAGPATPLAPSVRAVSLQTLGPNDVFEVRVFRHPELSQAYRVGPDGTIDFPLIGVVPVAGRTASQVAADLQLALGTDYIKSPQVSIFIKEYNSQKVSVFGQVSKPGTFPYAAGMNIIEAITMAGGFTNLASKDSVNITRVVDDREVRLTIQVDSILRGAVRNFDLVPGDIVYVPESIF